MVSKETKMPAYWQEFTVEDQDLDYLYELFLEGDNRPLTTEDLTLALIRKRCEREEELIKEKLAKGTIFQPKASYEVGQQVVFPALGYALASVVGVRPGYNPKYGDFEVIQVRFEGQEEIREFASKLNYPHKLNSEEGWLEAEGSVTPMELYNQYGADIRRKLLERLQLSSDFVNFRDEWYLRGLLAKIHEGHLNIVEAMLDVKGTPLPAQELLEELDLPADIPPVVQVFSLNYALLQDERFDNVGSGGQNLWFLRRLEPPEVVKLPPRLRYTPVLYDEKSLSDELLRWEREIDDEISELTAPHPGEEVSSVTIVLNYPHRRIGSIPLTSKTAGLFPKGDNERMMITLIDGQTGKRMPGWVVRRYKYVYGLKEWYDKNDIPVGAYVKLERTDDPLAVVVAYLPHGRKREWIRVATVEKGKLTFTMQMRAIGCKYDDLMILGENDPAEIDALWRRVEEQGKPISELVQEIFPELAKLNPQGTVHAKTLYSAVNMIRRCPPGPILAELARLPALMAVGDGYWVYDREAL